MMWNLARMSRQLSPAANDAPKEKAGEKYGLAGVSFVCSSGTGTENELEAS
jgi:hypothetical protein